MNQLTNKTSHNSGDLFLNIWLHISPITHFVVMEIFKQIVESIVRLCPYAAISRYVYVYASLISPRGTHHSYRLSLLISE